MNPIRVSLFFIFVLLVSFTSAGTSRAQELQVPLDEDGTIEHIDSKLERKLGLFPDYEGFKEARLFRVSDSTFVLEILYRSGEDVVRDRLPLTAAQVVDLRRNVTERITRVEPHALLNQEGRTELLAGTLVLSLGYYGWAVPVAAAVDEPRTFTTFYMVTSGAGFFIPLVLTRTVRVTDAATTLSLYGGSRGIAHGFFLHAVINDWDVDARGAVLSGMLTSLAEGVSFFYLADRSNMSLGTAEVIGIGGDFGIGWGLCASHLVGISEDHLPRVLAANLLVGSGVGMLAGTFLANDQPYTRGDAYVLRSVGILGSLIPVAIVDLIDPGEDKIYTGALLAGSAAGLGLGHRLVRGKDFTAGQGRLISLGELAGGLIGLGVAYQASSEDDRALYLTLSALGASGGFWIMYNSYAESAQNQVDDSSWNIDIVPYWLLFHVIDTRESSSTRKPVPLIRLEFNF